jgi:predicted 3-demethylubiquinone-9 3-methyltransferase (glyoxalase superfamily)
MGLLLPVAMEDMMADKDKARSKRVTDAMLKMIKLDIAALERAYRG